MMDPPFPCFRKIEIYEFLNFNEVTGSGAFIRLGAKEFRALSFGQELLG